MSPSSHAKALPAESIASSAARVDRFFAGLFLAEWVLRIGLAYVRPAHEDALFTAMFIGAFVASVPTILVVWKPGIAATRQAIAVAQMLYGALLVHLTKGAFETHAHVYFSLAILALYRDPMVIVTAVAVGVVQAFALNEPAAAAVQAMWILGTGGVLAHAARLRREDADRMAALAAELEVARRPAAPAPVVEKKVVAEEDPTKLLPLACVPPPASSRRLDCSILLVEDDPDSQKILTNHLERAGVSVAIAPNGEAALSEVSAASRRGQPFDLVLMDMHMPIMNGYEATAELRRRGYGAPILAMKGDPARSLDAGCTEHITKATSRDHLLQAVVNHGLGSAATLPPPARANQEAIFSDHPDSGEMHELLDAFVARLHQNAIDLEKAAAAGDASELELLAHRLRGTASSYGFMAISEAAGVLEDAIQRGAATADASAKLASLCRRAQTRSFSQAA